MYAICTPKRLWVPVSSMKRIVSILLCACMMLGAAACSAPAAELTATPKPASMPAPTLEIVMFNDEVLEGLIREQMGKPEGDITLVEAEAVERFDFKVEDPGSPSSPRIKDISALQYFKNLKSLDLSYHLIKDLSPIVGLKKLEALYYFGAESVKDFSALAELTGMLDIILAGNDHFSNADLKNMAGMVNMGLFWIQNMKNVTDISAVSAFSKLYKLNVEGTGVTDISPIADLPNLVEVSLRGSPISDVSPLQGLVNLKSLLLEGCPVADYSPLKGIYPNLENKDFELK